MAAAAGVPVAERLDCGRDRRSQKRPLARGDTLALLAVLRGVLRRRYDPCP